MKKNLFTVFALALLSLILFLPMSARAESITTAVVRTRLDELKEMVGDFFTADGGHTTCGSYDYTHKCPNCMLENILKSDWIRAKFGKIISPYQVGANGPEYNSEAFAHYAEWYLYRESADAAITWYQVRGASAFTFDTIAQSAQLGDVICLRDWKGSGYDQWGIITEFQNNAIRMLTSHNGGSLSNWISLNDFMYNSSKKVVIYRGYPSSYSSYIKIGWPERSYVIYYNRNGGKGSMAAQAAGYMTGSLTLSSNAFTREGYEFTGWVRYRNDGMWYVGGDTPWVPQGEGTPYLFTDRMTFSNGVDRFWIKDCTSNPTTFTFYAQWKQVAPKYTIYFSGNGGSGTMSSIEKYAGYSVKLPANQFTRENYDFRYWALRRADGKWYVSGKGFYTMSEINANGWSRANWVDEATLYCSPDWVSGYSGENSFTLYAQWIDADVIRLYGSTRYDTAIAIADRWKTVKNVSKFPALVLASGESPYDALSGSYLANKKGCPLLITSPEKASKMNTYIKNNLTAGATIYVLGGTQAMPSGTYSALQSAGYKITRLAGSSRYDTNLKILKALGEKPKHFIVCTGTNYADALSASAVPQPILLVGSSLTADQQAYLNSLGGGIGFTILGGTQVVPTKIYNQLKSYGYVKRIYGDTRYDTAVKVAQEFADSTYRVMVTVGNNFPDSLCAGPLAMQVGMPIVLVKGELDKPTQYTAAASYMQSVNCTHGYVCGSSRLITDAAVKQLFKGSN